MTTTAPPHTALRVDLGGRVELMLWVAAWLLSGFYLLPPGSPQVSDAVLAMLFAGIPPALVKEPPT